MKRLTLLALLWLLGAAAFSQIYPGGAGKLAAVGGAGYRDITASLLHHWTFDDVYTDSVGSMTWVPAAGTPTFTTGVFNNAVSLTAADNNLEVASVTVAAVDGAGDFTATVWIRPGTESSLVVAWDITNASFELIGFAAQLQGQVNGQAGFIRAQSGSDPGAGQWTFAALTWDETADELILYQGTNGGTLTPTVGVPSSFVGPRVTAGTVFLRTGYFVGGTYLQDDLRVYSITLTQTELQLLYNEGKTALGL